MKSFAVLCLLGIFLATAFAVQVPIHIENDGDDATRVRVTVSNPSTQHSLVLTPYGSPLAIDSAASFAVTDVDSATVLDYTGAVFKRVWPPADDSLVVVAPQQSYSRVVDLTAGYDLEAGRSYAVAVHASAAVRGMFVDEAQQRRSVDGQLGELFAASSSALPLFEAQRAQPVLMRPQASSTPFGLQQASAAHVARADQTVDCGTPSQNDFITQAIALSRQQTDWAKQFVDNGCQGSGYTTWFGTVTTNRYNIVHDCVTNINALLKSDYGVKWIVDCGGPCDPGVYAYVYPSQTAAPKRIYVCSAFWTAATTWPAEDSNGGVFIHEASHFNDICATDDHVYGSSGAKALAISNPAQAVNNADNYEYFAEAKPTICSSTTTASASTSASTSASGTTSATTSASGTTSATTSASGTTSATTSASGTTSATTTVSRTTTTTNNNGGGGSSSGCFAASSRVRVQLDDGSVVSKQLRDVQVGDKLESVDADFKAVFSDVYAVLHKDDERAVPMLQLTLAHNAGAVKLTAHHLILAAADAASWRLVDAASVKPGDYLLASAGPRRVVDVRPFTDAVRAPLTLNDRIVVDGVAASAFAHSETLYSPLTAPLKLAYALAPSALASSPVQSLIDTVVGWTDAFEQRVAVAPASF